MLKKNLFLKKLVIVIPKRNQPILVGSATSNQGVFSMQTKHKKINWNDSILKVSLCVKTFSNKTQFTYNYVGSIQHCQIPTVLNVR
ncbi:MAG: hypothetical protein RLZZ381_3076 [Cyanobacteriota bacterium]|jgi:hypothetical protein